VQLVTKPDGRARCISIDIAEGRDGDIVHLRALESSRSDRTAGDNVLHS
jgi:hypothetical protein